MKTKTMIFPLVQVLLFAAASAPLDAAAVRFRTSGSYVDSGGSTNSWSINEARALIWNGAPYIPVGFVFVSKSIASGSTAEDFQSDVAALEEARNKGVSDIVVKSSGPLTSCDPKALQRLLDHLDQSGFAYGLEIDDGPTAPLSGFIVSPNIYRMDGPSTEASFSWKWANVDAAIYTVVNKISMNIDAIGGAQIRDGRVTVALAEPLTASQVLTVYPRKQFVAANGTPLGDLWGGFGEYRDRLLDFFKDIKFGPGLRFFLEPLNSKVDFTGEDGNLVPDSPSFRIGFEAYLTRKYVHEGSLNSSWALNDNIDSIQTATRLVPLWGAGRGVAVAYDRGSAKRYPVDSTVSLLWRDMHDYRDNSAQEYMNTIADTLKTQVADVPVVFKSSKYHRVYANPYGIGGFDGLGAVSYGTDETLVTGSAGHVYALGEEAGKSTWFITASTAPTTGAYPTEMAMVASLDVLREIGCKGFFVESEAAPDLGWLNAFRERVKGARSADFVPHVVHYPAHPPTGAYMKRLARDTWWLPTLKLGRSSFIGDGLGAYAIAGEDGVYLWSSTGKKTVTFKAGPAGMPSMEFPEKKAFPKNKSGTYSVTLSDLPTLIRGVDITLVFPYETAQTEMDILSKMIVEADKLKVNVQKAKDGLERAKTVLKKGQPLIAFGMAQSAIQELVTVRGGEIWLEGESSPAQSFSAVRAMGGASGNLALVLDTPDDPPMSPYGAYYSFDVPLNSSYEIWVAATLPADASPISYSVDNLGWTTMTADAKPPEDYAPGLAWYRIGSSNLTPGRHTLRFRADGKRSQDNRHYFALDALVVSPSNFRPDGIRKPF